MLLKKYKILFYNRTISFILVQHYTGRTPKRRFLLLALSHHFNIVVHSLILNLFLRRRRRRRNLGVRLCCPRKDLKGSVMYFYLFLFHSPSTVFIIFFLFFFFDHHSFVLVFFLLPPSSESFSVTPKILRCSSGVRNLLPFFQRSFFYLLLFFVFMPVFLLLLCL